jgi:hypothetical protein
VGGAAVLARGEDPSAGSGCARGPGVAGRGRRLRFWGDRRPSGAFARQAYPRPNLRFVLGPFERIAAEGPFDHIVCCEVLEHLYLEQAQATLALFARAASPGATLVITTPNVRSAWPAIEWLLDRSGLVPALEEAQHLTLFSRGLLRTCCEQAGWRVEELGAFNGVAPFLAPLSERLARGTERAEFVARRWLPASLLYCRARRPV